MTARKRILVIGGGIAGASFAYEAASNYDVTLVEAESAAGYHATGRSAAMYLSSYGSAPIRALTAGSRSFFETPPPGFVEADLLRRRGLLTIATPGDSALLDGECYMGQERLSPAAARSIVPSLSDGATEAASFDRDAADIDVDLLHQGYVRGARARGATVALGVSVNGGSHVGGAWRVETSGGPIGADVVVNAAGAWADDVGALCGAVPMGIVPMRRTAVLIDAPAVDHFDRWPMVMTAREDLYFKPDAGLLMISPADETPVDAYDAQPDEWDVAVAIDRFEQLCDVRVRRIAHRWAGLRSFAPDRNPTVGWDDSVPGLFWFAGQGGYGIQIAPALAQLGAGILSGNIPADLAALTSALCPGRFSRQRD